MRDRDKPFPKIEWRDEQPDKHGGCPTAAGWVTIDDNGEECYHQSKVDAVTSMFNWCGCGMPVLVLEYVKAGLEHINEKRPDGYGHGPESLAKWETWYDARRLKVFGSLAAAEFFYYWADAEGLTEHGVSVPGWLDTKGKQLITLIDEALSEEEGT